MDIVITGRHMEVTPSIREYAAKKLAHIDIDFPRIVRAHFVLEVQKYRHIAALLLHCANHITIEASAVSDDLYASLDAVVAKVARQMRKHKTRVQRHRAHHSLGRKMQPMGASAAADNAAVAFALDSGQFVPAAAFMDKATPQLQQDASNRPS